MFWRRLALLCTALVLGACSTTRLIDSDVRSQSFFKATPTAGYRFERKSYTDAGVRFHLAPL